MGQLIRAVEFDTTAEDADTYQFLYGLRDVLRTWRRKLD